jgi:hypothetical protein
VGGGKKLDRAAASRAKDEAASRLAQVTKAPESRRLQAEIEEALRRTPELQAEAESITSSILSKLQANPRAAELKLVEVYEAQQGLARLLGGKGPRLVKRGGVYIRTVKVHGGNKETGATEETTRDILLLSTGQIAENRYAYPIKDYPGRALGPRADVRKVYRFLETLVKDLKDLDDRIRE